MELSLSTYQPLDATKQVRNYIVKTWAAPAKDLFETLKKICCIVLAVFSLLPVLVFDGLLSSVCLIYRASCCYSAKQNSNWTPVPDSSTVLKPPSAPSKLEIPADIMRKLSAAPYPHTPDIDPLITSSTEQRVLQLTADDLPNNSAFFADAIKEAFSILGPETKEKYKKCLERGEMREWSAAALIVHLLRTIPFCSDDYYDRKICILYPIHHPALEEVQATPQQRDAAFKHLDRMGFLWSAYDKLSRTQRIKVILNIIDPETYQWTIEQDESNYIMDEALSIGKVRSVVKRIQERARAMCKDPYFNVHLLPVILETD